MKKLPILLLLLSICFSGYSKDVAILISLEGNGYLTREGSKQALKIPQSFQDGDVVTMYEGSAYIMYYSGKDVSVAEGSTYTVKENTTSEKTEYFAMSDNGAPSSLLFQSGDVYNIRGVRNINPAKSKFRINETLILVVGYPVDSLNLQLSIKENTLQKEVYSQKITDTLVRLTNIPVLAGKTYTWSVSGTPHRIPEQGTIVVEAMNFNKKPLSTRLDYMNEIAKMYEDGYEFKAIDLCLAAKNLFPNSGIFDVMFENLLK